MKTLLLAVSLTCLAVISYGQDSEKYERAKIKSQEIPWDAEKAEKYNDWKARPGYHEGYIIDIDSNKVEGIIIDKAASSVKIVLPSGETRKYSASKCLLYGFDSFRFVPKDGHFIQLLYELKSICVYKATGHTPTVSGNAGVMITRNSDLNEVATYYMRRNTEKDFTIVSKVNFASKFSKYFSDCPYLKENIKNKSLGSSENDLTAIAAIYDRECAPTNK
jgi:hypothetical protein